MAGQFPTETIQIRKFVGERYWGGRYLDIGAGHPERLSNTFDLYQAAWTGDLYEPNEGFWRKLAVRRPRDVVHPVAVSDSSGWQTFWQNGELSTL